MVQGEDSGRIPGMERTGLGVFGEACDARERAEISMGG